MGEAVSGRTCVSYFILKRFDFFLERGERREKERERNIDVREKQSVSLPHNQFHTPPQLGTWSATQARAPTSPLSHTSQGRTWVFENRGLN